MKATAWRYVVLSERPQAELDELRQRLLAVEGDNARLKSLVDVMRSDNEALHRKVVSSSAACRAGSPTLHTTSDMTVDHRQLLRTVHQQPVCSSCWVV